LAQGVLAQALLAEAVLPQAAPTVCFCTGIASGRAIMNPFAVGPGGVKVSDSATVLCVRQRLGAPAPLTVEHCGGQQSPFIRSTIGVFGARGAINFEGGWEVLLGQNEVVNWLKSSPEKLVTMRYAGEWKLPGGNVDEHETIHAAAERELSEEFLTPLGLTLPRDAVLRPFVTKQTRPIRSQSNLMHCFVALELENPWLRDLDVASVNRGLEARRQRFAELAVDRDGTPTAAFWALPRREREVVTPEVRLLAWVPLRDAVMSCMQSMTPGLWVNEFQERAFAKHKVKRRDPMFMTGACLIELEGFPDMSSLVAHCQSVDLAQLTREEQWIFQGMSQQEMDAAYAKRVDSTGNPSFKSGDVIAELRRSRALAASGLGGRSML